MVEVVKVDDGHVVEINENEALELIKSLSSQLLSKSSNAGRIEFGQPYFTIAIKFLPSPQCNPSKNENTNAIIQLCKIANEANNKNK